MWTSEVGAQVQLHLLRFLYRCGSPEIPIPASIVKVPCFAWGLAWTHHPGTGAVDNLRLPKRNLLKTGG